MTNEIPGLRAVTKKDAIWLANYPKCRGGWVTAWGDDSNGHDLPELIEAITGRDYLTYVPSDEISCGTPVTISQLDKIVNRSKNVSGIPCLAASEAERREWIDRFQAVILKGER